MDDLREQLAALAHEQWSGWMRYLFSKCVPNADGSGVTVPAAYESALVRQMTTAFEWLSDAEKDSDRYEADRVLAIVTAWQSSRTINKSVSAVTNCDSGNRICAVEGCQARAYAQHNYCTRHRLRFERTGDPMLVRKRGRKTK